MNFANVLGASNHLQNDFLPCISILLWKGVFAFKTILYFFSETPYFLLHLVCRTFWFQEEEIQSILTYALFSLVLYPSTEGQVHAMAADHHSH